MNSNKVVEDSVNVTVKHIAPISSMFISAGNPSNPSNGGSSSVGCGGQNITISIPTPTTDPFIPVSFFWTLPSGWSGSSSTSSITATTNQGLSDQILNVRVRRNDGQVDQTYTVTITRPRVTNAIISSVNWSPDDKPLCNGETRQLSGTSTANASTFSWSSSGGIG